MLSLCKVAELEAEGLLPCSGGPWHTKTVKAALRAVVAGDAGELAEEGPTGEQQQGGVRDRGASDPGKAVDLDTGHRRRRSAPRGRGRRKVAQSLTPTPR